MRAKSEYPARHGDQHLADGSDPIPGLLAGMRFMWGAIDDDATIIDSGSGDWTAEWADQDGSSPFLNIYTIRFSPAFDEAPVAVAIVNDEGTSPVLEAAVGQVSVTADYVVLMTLQFDGTVGNYGFNFHVIGAAT